MGESPCDWKEKWVDIILGQSWNSSGRLAAGEGSDAVRDCGMVGTFEIGLP